MKKQRKIKPPTPFKKNVGFSGNRGKFTKRAQQAILNAAEKEKATALRTQLVAEELLRARTKRFLQVISGCLTKCGNKKRAITLVGKTLFDYATTHRNPKKRGRRRRAAPSLPTVEPDKSAFTAVVESLLPAIKNRKQHVGRKVHFIPLPFSSREHVKAPVKLAAHWFYQALLKNNTPTKLRNRIQLELQSIDLGTSEVLKKKLATYRTAIDAKPSIRFYRFLKKL